jgi:hypothetical protein
MALLCNICIGVLQYQRNLYQPYPGDNDMLASEWLEGGQQHLTYDEVTQDDDQNNANEAPWEFEGSEDDITIDDEKTSDLGVHVKRDRSPSVCGTTSHASRILCGHHRTVETLALSAASKCHICCPFWEQLSRPEQESLRVKTCAASISSSAKSNTASVLIEDFPVDFLTYAAVSRGASDRHDFRLNIRFNPFAETTVHHKNIRGVYVLEEISG